jgi:hypothetical protein
MDQVTSTSDVTAQMAAERPWVSPQQACDYLRSEFGYSVQVLTLAHYRRIGTGPAFFKVGRRVRYARAEIDRWVLSRVSTPAAKVAA